MYPKKKLICAFIDFNQAAVNTAWRKGLWYNIFKSGKKNIYKGIKSNVKLHDETTPFFYCNLGLHIRQGENFSPFLFSKYINNIECFKIDINFSEFTIITNDTKNDLLVSCKLFFILFFADDNVLLSESASYLQHAIDDIV